MIPKRPLIPHPTDPQALLVPLAKSKDFAIIDAKYAEEVAKHNWYLGVPSPNNRYGYPTTNTPKENGKSRVLRLHRLIARLAGFEGEAEEVGCRDRSGLDCRRSNLRPQSPRQSKAKQGLRSNNTSGYKGVTWHADHGKWVARINVGSKNLYLGSFTDKIEAAKAYDAAAIEHFGEFAYLNLPVVVRFRWPDDPATLDEVMTAVEALRQEVERLRQSTPQQMVDLKAAAEHLGVHERTVKRWVKEGRVPFRRVGRTLRFPLAALNPAG